MAAAALLSVAPAASPREIEDAYLQRLAELKSAFLLMGGFERHSAAADKCFDNFAEGESNAIAVAACRGACEAPGVVNNPLYLYGKTGLGKTHLVSAVAQEMRARRPDRTVALISADAFSDELVNAIAENTVRLFNAKYRSVDVLLVDGVHLWGNRVRTQEEILSIVDHLARRGRQVVFTANCPPLELVGIGEALTSRLSGGLVVEINYPELDTRRRIVQTMARRLDLEVSREVVYQLARRVETDVRALEAALLKVQAHQRAGCQDIPRLILDGAPPAQASLSLDDVVEVVTSHFKMEARDIVNGRGGQKINKARQIAMYLARTLTDMSLHEIGRCFGANPNQVRYAEQKIRQTLEEPLIARDVASLRKRLTAETGPTRPRR